MVQDIQNSPFRDLGLLSLKEIDAVSKLQQKEDASARARIQGRESTESSAGANGHDGSVAVQRRPAQMAETATYKSGPSARMRLEVGPYTSFVDVALGLTKKWTLNKLQLLAVLIPASFLDARDPRPTRGCKKMTGASTSNTSAAKGARASLALYTPSRTCSG